MSKLAYMEQRFLLLRFFSATCSLKETKSGGFVCPPDLAYFASPVFFSHSSRFALHCSSVGCTMVNNLPVSALR